MSSAEVMRNAAALLRAAYRRNGSYSWNGGACTLIAPRRHHLGWAAFSWREPERTCTVDLARHRGIAKAEARRIIATLRA